LEIQLAKANLQVLKSQLQPHFLFNTMHSISGLMFTDVRAADKMMTRLSELLRMSLEEGTEQTTTLNRELEFATGYLEIEKMRLGDRLNVDLNISPETLDAEVPHLLLQPLIENAVQYGVSKLASKGEIKIASRREGPALWLTISDNGPGFHAAGGPNRKPGLGIGTSRERLQTLYGENQSLSFQVPEGGGTEITIRIPFRPTIHTGPNEE
jgi:LytS/YehU family sensor histidine kinase